MVYVVASDMKQSISGKVKIEREKKITGVLKVMAV